MYRFFNKLTQGTIVKTEKLRDFEVVNKLFFHLQVIDIEVKLHAIICHKNIYGKNKQTR